MKLIRKRALGDVLWIEPVIRALALKYRKITVVSHYNDLFINYPLPNVHFRSTLTLGEKVLVRLDRLLGSHFFSIDLDGVYERSPKRPILETYQEKAGVPLTREYPRIYLDEAEKHADPNGGRPYIVLHLESLTDKNYRKAFGIDWTVISGWLREQGYDLFQVGKNPAPIPGVTHRQTSIREMIVLLSKASMFIGLDSGPSHIAAAMEVPCLLFFGAVNPLFRHFPEMLKGIILQGPCPYAGCFHEAPDPEVLVCRVVGSEGIPPCSLHTTDSVLEAISTIRNKYLC